MFSMSTFLIILFVLLLVATIAAILTPDEKYKKRNKHHWWQDDPNRLVKYNGKYYRRKDMECPPTLLPRPKPGSKPVADEFGDWY